MQTLFWILLSLLFYTYIGYGVLLSLFTSFFRRGKIVAGDFLPPVTFVVPAYNEEAMIEAKIQNSLALDYPMDKLHFVFVTDGSTDGTVALVQQHPQINLLHQTERKGKTAAINRAMQTVHTPLVVFSDANTFVQAQSIKVLARHFADSRVGGVSGEKQIQKDEQSTVGNGERLYWQYESWLKKINARFYTLVGAAGELFAIRTALYQQLSEKVILDDFLISGNVCAQGYRFLYEEEAVAVENSSLSIAEEQKRKVRISAGCYQALGLMGGLLNPFKNCRLAFQYLSHRVLRWTVCPLALPLLFVTNGWLFLNSSGLVYEILFWMQCVFYLVAFLGFLMTGRGAAAKIMLVPYYFVFMVLSQYKGFIRFTKGQQPAAWEKVRRWNPGEKITLLENDMTGKRQTN